MIIGEEEMKNERQLLTVEDGPLMQGRESVRYLIYNPQIEMFARFKMKSSFHKTKRII